jgi:hypothetical protein
MKGPHRHSPSKSRPCLNFSLKQSNDCTIDQYTIFCTNCQYKNPPHFCRGLSRISFYNPFSIAPGPAAIMSATWLASKISASTSARGRPNFNRDNCFIAAAISG